jgi:putative membrane protein
MRLIVRIIVNAIALYVAGLIVSGIGYDFAAGGILGFLLLALIFGVVNAIIRPIVMLLTCPLQILTLGLFTLVVNALMLLFSGWIADLLGLPFNVDGFWPAFWGGIIISIVSILLSIFLKDD